MRPRGLEFPVVFISGVEEGLIPHAEADIEEEKRLFFVGITRGQDEVILTRARSRRRFGERIAPKISRFVADIPEDIIDFVDLRTERRKPPNNYPYFKYRASRVRHCECGLLYLQQTDPCVSSVAD